MDVSIASQGGEAGHVFQSGEPLTVTLSIRAPRPVDDMVFGIGIFNAEGVCCYGTNTDIEGLQPAPFSGEGTVTFDVARVDLVDGTYKLDVAVHRKDGYPYDYHRLLYTFRVKSRTHDVGIYRPAHAWTFSPNIVVTRTTNAS
jgi:hypothetical protein